MQQGIVLAVGQAATQNVRLKPGAESQTVNVVAGAELINSTTPELGMAVDETSVTHAGNVGDRALHAQGESGRAACTVEAPR